MKRRMLWIIVPLVVLLMVIGVPIVLLLAQVDDWNRDLSSNTAATSTEAVDEALQPIRFQGDLADAVALVKQVAADLPRWELVDEQETAQGTELSLTRTSPLAGFVDDIQVQIESDGTALEINAWSESRKGKADFGQNPRNLKQLLSEVRARIEAED